MNVKMKNFAKFQTYPVLVVFSIVFPDVFVVAIHNFVRRDPLLVIISSSLSSDPGNASDFTKINLNVLVNVAMSSTPCRIGPRGCG